MPYDSVDDLPEQTKSLTDKQKRQWMKVFNSVYAQCMEKEEGDCDTHGAKAAWAAVKKVEEGKFTFLVDSLVITEGVKEGVYKAHGFALHPVVTHHPGEPPRDFSAVKEELIKAAVTLKGKHLDVDHSDVPVNPDINIITDSKWNFEVEAVEFWADIDDYLYELIQGGCPVSVSINWLIPNQGGIKVVDVNGEIGIAPYGFEFADPGLSILQQMTPGDPNAMIELLMESVSRGLNNIKNGVKKKLKKPNLKEQNGNDEKPPETGTPKTDKERFMAHFGIDEDAFQKLYDILGDELFKLLPERGQKVEQPLEEQGKAKAKTVKKLDEQSSENPPETPAKSPPETPTATPKTAEEVKARITELAKRRAEISEKLYPEAELSDDERTALTAEQETIWAEMDALGKALGEIIAAQVVGQLPEGYQIKVLHEPEDEHEKPPPEKSEKEKFIDACMAGEDGKTKEQCETARSEKQKPPEAKTQESADLVALRKQLVTFEAAKVAAENKLSEAIVAHSVKIAGFKGALEALIPTERTKNVWSMGPRVLVEQLKKLSHSL